MEDKQKQSGAEGNGQMELPDLQQSVMDQATLDQLFADLDALTEVTEIIPRTVARGYVPEDTVMTLEEARRLLLSGSIHGLQIRYNYQGSQWWDTLLPTSGGEGFRIVRIEHDFI